MSGAKKTAKSKTAAKKSVRAKSAQTEATTSASTSSMNRQSVGFLLAGTLAFGIGIGMIINSQNTPADGSAGQIDGQIATFIENNPKLILDTVRDYSMRMDQERRQQAINVVKANDGTTIMGNPDGDVTIYEFSDYNCGYCKRSFNVLTDLMKQDDNIRIVVKEFPILAQSSMDAAQLALGAGALGKYEEFHSALMIWPGGYDENAFITIAEQIGTTVEELRGAISSDEMDAVFSANREAAQQLNISGTPAFLVGDILMPGAVTLEELQDAISRTREANKG